MRVLVLGNDGYIGYPLTIHLLKRGHTVLGVDDYSRRRRVELYAFDSLTPITLPTVRGKYLKNEYLHFVGQVNASLGNDSEGYIRSIVSAFKPEVIVHLAEQPSAPWSMEDAKTATKTQHENVLGTLHVLWAMKEECPKAHLVKLGTMGEYGTPPIDIPEGMIPNKPCWHIKDVEINPEDLGPGRIIRLDKKCPMSNLLFPRQPGSFYHVSKVMDTYNVEFACRNWGLCSTDIMQGIVFGLQEVNNINELTRFDYDEYFGTVLNRFCAQALINHPLTIYGKGMQTRGFLTLSDSILCLTIAIENPPAKGEYRTWNQFENIYTLNTLAQKVAEAADRMGIRVTSTHIENPRNEQENHYYNPAHQKLLDLGYRPDTDIDASIASTLRVLKPYKERINSEVIDPTTQW